MLYFSCKLGHHRADRRCCFSLGSDWHLSPVYLYCCNENIIRCFTSFLFSWNILWSPPLPPPQQKKWDLQGATSVYRDEWFGCLSFKSGSLPYKVGVSSRHIVAAAASGLMGWDGWWASAQPSETKPYVCLKVASFGLVSWGVGGIPFFFFFLRKGTFRVHLSLPDPLPLLKQTVNK